MGRNILLLFYCLCAISGNAQSYVQFNNKIFEVQEKQKNNTSIYAQGEAIVFYSERNTITQFVLSNVSAQTNNLKSYTLKIKTNHIDGKLIAFGKEQIFNSDDSLAKSSSDSSFMFNLLNKESIITIKNNFPRSQKDTSASMLLVMQDDPAKYILPLNRNQIKLGYSWVDSIIITDSKSINQYIITKTNPDSIQLTVYKELQQTIKLLQDGKMIEQRLNGFSTSTRWYNTASSLLQNENSITNFSGSTNMGDQSLPITIAIQTSVQVKEKK